MSITNIFLNYPDVTAILWTNEYGIEEQVVMSSTKGVSRSRNQAQSGFAVDRQFFKTQGLYRSNDIVTISGLVCDDAIWETMLNLGAYPPESFSSRSSAAMYSLDFIFNKGIKVRVKDTTLSVLRNLIIIGLSYSPSTEFDNATDFQITLEEQRSTSLSYTQGDAEQGQTSDPYTFYEYDSLGKLK